MNSDSAPASSLLPAFDILTEGEIHSGIFLLIGPSGSGKTVYSLQFAVNSALEGFPVLCFSTERRPSELIHYANTFKWRLEDLQSPENIRLVDCYSSWSGLEAEGTLSLRSSSLSDIPILIEEAKRRSPFKVFLLDALTPILYELKPDMIYKFVRVLAAKMRRMGVLALFTLQDEVLDTRVVNISRSSFDGVLEMKVVEEDGNLERYFRIHTLRGAQHNPSWTNYKISPKGITFGEARRSPLRPVVDQSDYKEYTQQSWREKPSSSGIFY